MSADGMNVPLPGEPAYERQKDLLQSPDPERRRRLASAGDTRPEILYYLAGDSAPEVRRAVAGNPLTPAPADELLVRDGDALVRADLGGKLARLLPDVSDGAREQVRERVTALLHTLAKDQAVRVRQAVSESLKDVAAAPPELMRALARDDDMAVAAPILRCSPALTDQDLLDIIAADPGTARLVAIAGRSGLAAPVADAVVATSDEGAVAALLGNPSAQIREETLDLIVERAPDVESWHAPLASRPALPPRAARRIATFLAEQLLDQFRKRSDLDPATRAEVARQVEKRLAAGREAEAAPAADGENAEAEVRKLLAAGKLDEDLVLGAIDGGRRAFAKAALGALSGLPATIIDKILSSRSAKGVVALVWKAKLSMYAASKVQMRLAGIAPKQVLAARAGGAWPLSPDEMTWQLEFFGAAPAKR